MTTRPSDRQRLLAVGGIVGPVAFVAAWIGCGLATGGYSAVSNAISDLARAGVGVVSLGRGHDGLHGLFAGIGYAAIAATPGLAVGPLRRAARRSWATVSLVAAVAAGACLVATVAGPAHGFFQRAGLTIGDAWIVASAALILAGHRAPAGVLAGEAVASGT
jgi:hypothetical protein